MNFDPRAAAIWGELTANARGLLPWRDSFSWKAVCPFVLRRARRGNILPAEGARKSMADVFSKQKRSQVMAAIRSKGNKGTELKLVSILRAHGINGWRRNSSITGKPDFIFPKRRLAVFVDGCFWHGCRWHCRMPQTNRRFWKEKISRNAARDRTTTRLLRRSGWRVIRVWEHALKDSASVARRIKFALSRLEWSQEC